MKNRFVIIRNFHKNKHENQIRKATDKYIVYTIKIFNLQNIRSHLKYVFYLNRIFILVIKFFILILMKCL